MKLAKWTGMYIRAIIRSISLSLILREKIQFLSNVSTRLYFIQCRSICLSYHEFSFFIDECN